MACHGPRWQSPLTRQRDYAVHLMNFFGPQLLRKGAGHSSQAGAWPKQHPDSVSSALGSDHT